MSSMRNCFATTGRRELSCKRLFKHRVVNGHSCSGISCQAFFIPVVTALFAYTSDSETAPDRGTGQSTLWQTMCAR
eukprot:2318902-Amphidinium_carterae.1